MPAFAAVWLTVPRQTSQASQKARQTQSLKYLAGRMMAFAVVRRTMTRPIRQTGQTACRTQKLEFLAWRMLFFAAVRLMVRPAPWEQLLHDSELPRP